MLAMSPPAADSYPPPPPPLRPPPPPPPLPPPLPPSVIHTRAHEHCHCHPGRLALSSVWNHLRVRPPKWRPSAHAHDADPTRRRSRSRCSSVRLSREPGSPRRASLPELRPRGSALPASGTWRVRLPPLPALPQPPGWSPAPPPLFKPVGYRPGFQRDWFTGPHQAWSTSLNSVTEPTGLICLAAFGV